MYVHLVSYTYVNTASYLVVRRHVRPDYYKK